MKKTAVLMDLGFVLQKLYRLLEIDTLQRLK